MDTEVKIVRRDIGETEYELIDYNTQKKGIVSRVSEKKMFVSTCKIKVPYGSILILKKTSITKLKIVEYFFVGLNGLTDIKYKDIKYYTENKKSILKEQNEGIKKASSYKTKNSISTIYKKIVYVLRSIDETDFLKAIVKSNTSISIGIVQLTFDNKKNAYVISDTTDKVIEVDGKNIDNAIETFLTLCYNYKVRAGLVKIL